MMGIADCGLRIADCGMPLDDWVNYFPSSWLASPTCPAKASGGGGSLVEGGSTVSAPSRSQDDFW